MSGCIEDSRVYNFSLHFWFESNVTAKKQPISQLSTVITMAFPALQPSSIQQMQRH